MHREGLFIRLKGCHIRPPMELVQHLPESPNRAEPVGWMDEDIPTEPPSRNWLYSKAPTGTSEMRICWVEWQFTLWHRKLDEMWGPEG